MVNKPKTVGVTLLLALVLVMATILPVMADGNETNLPIAAESTLVEVLPVTPEVDEAANVSEVEVPSAEMMMNEAEVLKSVTVTLTTLEEANKTDWELISPDQGMWLFTNGTYDFCWEYSDDYGIPLKTVAIIPEGGSLYEVRFLAVRQKEPYDGSCTVNIPPDIERGAYTVVVALDYSGMQGTILQIRMYCDVLIFDEEPTAAFLWLMSTNPWSTLDENEKQPKSLPAEPKSFGFV